MNRKELFPQLPRFLVNEILSYDATYHDEWWKVNLHLQTNQYIEFIERVITKWSHFAFQEVQALDQRCLYEVDGETLFLGNDRDLCWFLSANPYIYSFCLMLDYHIIKQYLHLDESAWKAVQHTFQNPRLRPRKKIFNSFGVMLQQLTVKGCRVHVMRKLYQEYYKSNPKELLQDVFYLDPDEVISKKIKIHVEQQMFDETRPGFLQIWNMEEIDYHAIVFPPN